jgi:signal transduction histidine kinase
MSRAMLKRLSVRGKVVLVAMTTAVLGIIAMGGMSLVYQIYHERGNLLHEYATLARIVANRSSAALAFGDRRLAEENLQSLSPAPDFAGACIYDAEGNVLAELITKGAPCPAAVFDEQATIDGDHVHVSAPIMVDNEQVGAVYLRASTTRIDEARVAFVLLIITALGGTILLSYWMSTQLQRIVSDPIVRLASIARRVSRAHDYSLRAHKAGDDEVGELVITFNEMLATIEAQNNSLEEKKHSLEVQVARRTAELQRTNDELKAFSYSISHDLRAPLRAINGFAVALTEDHQAHLNTQGRDYLARIRNAANRMSELIDALLSLARMSNQEMSLTEVDLTRIARDCVAQLEAAEPGRAVALRIAEGMVTRGDPALLRSVMQNLIGNAWKYSRTVSQPTIEIGVGQDGLQSFYFVRDNGVGFDMQFSGKLFGAFQRLHAQDQFEGTGIGLATVARIVHRHGGRAWAEAAPGAGATFYFTLDTHDRLLEATADKESTVA